MNKQKILTGLIVTIIVGMLAIVVLGSKNKNLTQKQMPQKSVEIVSTAENIPTFFYGNTCPHCAEVEAWIKENKIEEKITIAKKEVYDNQQNAKALTKAAQNCNMSTDSIGVPFLYVDGKCFVGSPDVINYLSGKVGIK